MNTFASERIDLHHLQGARQSRVSTLVRVLAVGIAAAASLGTFGASAAVSVPNRPAAAALACVGTVCESGPRGAGATSRSLGGLPLAIEPNRGQARANALFVANNSGYAVAFGRGGSVVASSWNGARRRTVDTAMSVLGARPVVPIAGAKLPGFVNYFVGDNPRAWRRDIPTFARITYPNVYPGVDLTYSGTAQRLNLAFLVAPGVSASRIRLRLSNGTAGARHAATATAALASRMELTAAQATVAGTRYVSARFQVTAGGVARIDLGRHDLSRPLVIRSAESFTTDFCGSSSTVPGLSGNCTAVAVGPSDDAYVTGDMLGSAGPYPPLTSRCANPSWVFDGNNPYLDAFVTAMSPDGSTALWTTLIGGSDVDQGLAIAVDGDNNAYVTGATCSTDMPTLSSTQGTSAYGSSFGCGMIDGFVAKLDPSGNLSYSTYLPDTTCPGALPYSYYANWGIGIAVDPADRAYVSGWMYCRSPGDVTCSAFPIPPGTIQTAGGGYLIQVNGDGSALSYATALNNAGVITLNPACPSDCSVYMAGGDMSITGYETPPEQPWLGSAGDLAEICPGASCWQPDGGTTGSGMVFSAGLDTIDWCGCYGVKAISVDPAGNIFAAGTTGSQDFPVANGFQTSFPVGGYAGFVSELSPDGNSLEFSTFLGSDTGLDGIAAVPAGDPAHTTVVVVGNGSGTGTLPVTDGACQPANAGGVDAIVARIDPLGIQGTSDPQVQYATYLGGPEYDTATAVALDSQENAVVSGTSATGFDSSACAPTPDARRTAQRLTPGSGQFVTRLKAASHPWALPSLNGVRGGRHSIPLAWTLPFDGGKPLTRYAISFSGGGSHGSIAAESGALADTLAGLANGITYTVSVSAVNVLGVGTAVTGAFETAPVNLTYKGPASLPRGKPATLKVRLWSPGEPIVGRTVRISLVSGSKVQGCTTRPTNASGYGGCTLAKVKEPLGSLTLKGTFPGDNPAGRFRYGPASCIRGVEIIHLGRGVTRHRRGHRVSLEQE